MNIHYRKDKQYIFSMERIGKEDAQPEAPDISTVYVSEVCYMSWNSTQLPQYVTFMFKPSSVNISNYNQGHSESLDLPYIAVYKVYNYVVTN